MLPTTDTAWSIAVAVLLALVGAVAAWWRRGRTKRERDAAIGDAILGEPEVTDRAGTLISPAKPGLVQRTITLEASVKTLVDLIADQTEMRRKVDNHEARLGIIEPTVATLINASRERAATAEAATEALKLVRDNGTIDVESSE